MDNCYCNLLCFIVRKHLSSKCFEQMLVCVVTALTFKYDCNLFCQSLFDRLTPKNETFLSTVDTDLHSLNEHILPVCDLPLPVLRFDGPLTKPVD